MKTFHRDAYATASITDLKDGKARLVVKSINGTKIQDSTHKSRGAALAAWRRMYA